MICTFCGTPLPEGALFCGECGRKVSQDAAAEMRRPADDPAVIRVPDFSNAGMPGPRSDPEPTAAHDTDAVAKSEPGSEPLTELEAEPEPAPEPAEEPEAEPEPAPEPSPVVTAVQTPAEDDAAETAAAFDPGRCEQCGAAMAPGDIFCGDCGFVSRDVARAFSRPSLSGETRPLDFELDELFPDAPPVGAPVALEPPADTARPVAWSPEARAAGRSGRDDSADIEDIEETRIVPRSSGQRFVLQFSTGESVAVTGTGLIGRNPRSEPGEFFDQVVRVLDGGRSVSKTHLEFGQEAGVFWIKDRFSGNGTVVREPESSPRRCEPDRRYRVSRGCRVEIGEQFFIVS